MTLNIRLFSLPRFSRPYQKNEYLQQVLIPKGGNSYTVEKDDTTEIRRLFIAHRIKFTVSDYK